MLSRVADAIYWCNRYMERVENLTRYVEANLYLGMELPDGTEEQWEPLILTSGDQEDFNSRYENADRESVIKFLTIDEFNPNSILSCLSYARENARSVRETMPSIVYQRLNDLYLDVKGYEADSNKTMNFLEFFQRLKQGSHLYFGEMDACVYRNETWHFAHLGKFIERADKTSRMLDMKYYYLLPKVSQVGTPLDLLQWSSLLRSSDAFEMYRQEHGALSIENIIKFLLLDQQLPRSAYYCLQRIQDCLHNISGCKPSEYSNQAERKIGMMRSRFQYMEVSDILRMGLHEYLDQFQTEVNELGCLIEDTFFSLAVEVNRLVL